MQNCVERETARATVHNGVAEHSTPTDERAIAGRASERHHSFVFAYYTFSLSLSSDTWDGGAQPVATMRAHPGVLQAPMTALFASISTSASRPERPKKPSPDVRGLLQHLSPCQQAHDTTPEIGRAHV